MAPTGPGGEGESDDDPGGANQADLGYQGEGVATSGKKYINFSFFSFNLFYFISIFLRLAAAFQNQTEGKKKKKTARELLRAVSAEAPATLIVLTRCQFLLH